ncbi:hypothetical protein [Bacillus suaedae]|uniref:DUF4367 domain-containing protein n=1 Tax=Halalkalibacter suaedae TaxID=2822140 RepID=A0A941API0_9BACI|nr:hypothetical protein [Bacillus suaedae]MBP3951821.1 hypothetical protein [Bacillus suaedae]
MIKRIFERIVLFSIIVLAACNMNSQSESILNPILSEFQEAGITLKEETEKAKTFSFPGSDEKYYEFKDGYVYLIYNFDSKEVIIDKLTTIFAEAEFPYDVNSLYTYQFIIIFIASSENPDIAEKIESIFQKLKDH